MGGAQPVYIVGRRIGDRVPAEGDRFGTYNRKANISGPWGNIEGGRVHGGLAIAGDTDPRRAGSHVGHGKIYLTAIGGYIATGG